VVTRDSLHYRKLTDKPKAKEEENKDSDKMKDVAREKSKEKDPTAGEALAALAFGMYASCCIFLNTLHSLILKNVTKIGVCALFMTSLATLLSPSATLTFTTEFSIVITLSARGKFTDEWDDSKEVQINDDVCYGWPLTVRYVVVK
jgi:hypothetical protein